MLKEFSESIKSEKILTKRGLCGEQRFTRMKTANDHHTSSSYLDCRRLVSVAVQSPRNSNENFRNFYKTFLKQSQRVTA